MEKEKQFDIKKYHQTLCPNPPDFLNDYLGTPSVQHLAGVGLLCGTDWTPLFKNRFFYSRLDHSLGVALIIWNFTHDKKQTLAGLFHDISTPNFSHVMDFKNGDTLVQESTESLTAKIINEDITLSQKLFSEGIYKYEIDNYHRYAIADTDIPGLCADRLEYMFPSGAILCDNWNNDSIAKVYSEVRVLQNEHGLAELGFKDLEAAVEYTKKYLEVSKILQMNEDKLSMQMLADVVARALECGFVTEDDLYTVREKDMILLFDRIADTSADEKFTKLWHTFRQMTKVIHTEEPMENSYCISLDVKKRFVNPLVGQDALLPSRRVSELSPEADECIKEFLAYKDSRYGCVPWL